MSGATTAVDAALADLTELLAADGYQLSWSVNEDNRVVVTIEAGTGACADCLVPVPVLESIMTDALASTPYALAHVLTPVPTPATNEAGEAGD